ncbi:hypothetical protein [uncultured Kordia sp.]|nr:hypothetical protein [uncultured Kordia sp.]
MKKQSLKVLKLNKNVVSTFDLSKVKGGYSHSNNVLGTQENCCHPL